MSNDRIVRVQYFPQQFLRTQDFTEEQAYHLAMRRRHNIAHHLWGIVHGLELRVEEDGLFVLPGLAIDGYGRELILTERRRIAQDEFTHRNSDELAVWLQYGRQSSDEAPEGYFTVCDEEETTAYYRWQEIPMLVIERPEPGYLNAREPDTVPAADLPFAAHRTPPDDPAQPWPVYLGRLTRDRSDPAEPVYKVEPAGRPAVGLVGETITSPSGRAQVALEGKVAEASDASSGASQAEVRPSRFSVSLCHQQACDRDNPLSEHLSITSAGEIDLKGRASIHGDLRMAGGAIEFRPAPVGDGQPPLCDTAPAAAEMEDEARPWRIYRYRCRQDGQNGEPPPHHDELRIELAPVTGDKQQVVVGAWSPEDEAFKPFLTVGNVYHPAGEYSVTVHGNLIVTGSIEKEEAPVAGNLTAEARNFLLGTYSSGVSGANLQLADRYQSPFSPTVCDVDSDDGQQGVIEALMEHGSMEESRLVRFVRKLLLNAQGREEVVSQLAANAAWVGELMDAALPQDAPRAQIVSKVVVDPVARDDIQAALAGDVTLVDEFMDKALATDPPRGTVVSRVVNHSAARDAAQVALVANTAWTGEFMAKAVADDGARPVAVTAVVGDATARDDAENALVANPVWTGEFMAKAVADEDARPVAVTAVVNDDTARDDAQVELVANPAWTGEFMAKAVADDGARPVAVTAVVNDDTARDDAQVELVANLVWTGEFMTKAVADDGARPVAVAAVVDDDTARGEAEDALVANTTWLNEFMDKALSVSDGRRAVAERLDAEEARAIAFATMDWLSLPDPVTFADWQANYPTLAPQLQSTVCV